MDEQKKSRQDKAEERLRQRAEHVAERLATQQKRVDQRFQRVNERLQKDLPPTNPFNMWTNRKAGGRPPKLSREEMVETATRLADEEGFDALSMRRLAQELGTGTMSLYHYVQTKDELLALVMNHIMEEITLEEGEQMPEFWQDAMRLLAHRTKDAILRHSWMLDIRSDPSNGPNAFLHFEQTLQAMRSMNVSNARKFEIAALIDEYVFGYCWHSRSNEVQLTAISTYEQQYLQSLLNADGFPEMTKLVDSYGVPGLWAQVVAAATDASRFDRNLDRLFNGIQAELDASQSKRSRRVE